MRQVQYIFAFGFNANCCCEAEIGCNSPQQQSLSWEISERQVGVKMHKVDQYHFSCGSVGVE